MSVEPRAPVEEDASPAARLGKAAQRLADAHTNHELARQRLKLAASELTQARAVYRDAGAAFNESLDPSRLCSKVYVHGDGARCGLTHGHEGPCDVA